MGVDHGDFPITWAAIRREIHRLAKMTLQNASIGRAGLRVYGGGWIRIINGGLQVIGSAIIEGLLEITGNLTGSGPFLWTGPWELRGAGKITGDVEIDGKARIKNDATLEADLTVLPDGKVKVGNMTIDPSVGGGSIVFDNGAQLFTNGDSIQVYKGNGAFQVNNTETSVHWGGNAIVIDGDGMRGTFGAVRSIGGTGHPANSVVLDSNRYFRVADGT